MTGPVTFPLRIWRQRSKGWRIPKNTVCVTRPGIYSNPYFPGSGYSRGFFDGDMKPAQLDVRDPRVQVKWFRERMHQMACDEPGRLKGNFIDPLKGMNLACWCRLCQAHADGKPLGVHCDNCAPCHADVLLEFVNPDIMALIACARGHKCAG